MSTQKERNRAKDEFEVADYECVNSNFKLITNHCSHFEQLTYFYILNSGRKERLQAWVSGNRMKDMTHSGILIYYKPNQKI